MSLRKRAAKANLRSPTSAYFNQQTTASNSRLANATQTLNNPYAPPVPSSPVEASIHSYTPRRRSPANDSDFNPSALASSPVSTPVSTPSYEREEEDDLLPEMPHALSPGRDSGPPAKRIKLDEAREAAEVDDSENEVAESPTTNRLTLIGASALAKLRDDKTQLLAANAELAKDNAKLKKKLANHDQMAAENDVLKVENKGLEGSLEREQADNEELQVQLGQVRIERGQLRQQLVRVQRDLAQLQRDYQGLVVAYNELHARTVAAAAPAPEPEVDLAGGFPRFF